MERKIRRAERAIPDSEAKEILQAEAYGVLSTVSEDGQPYGVPVSYSYAGDVIYFHCALEGHKLENLSSNNRVSFCVVGKTQVLPDKFATNYESVIVFSLRAGRTQIGEFEHQQQGLVLRRRQDRGAARQVCDKLRECYRIWQSV